MVAAVHEFGQGDQAEVPFFRTAIAGSSREIAATIRRGVNPRTMTFDEGVARQAGEVLKSAIVRNIRSAPLVDTATLAASVSVKTTPSS